MFALTHILHYFILLWGILALALYLISAYGQLVIGKGWLPYGEPAFRLGTIKRRRNLKRSTRRCVKMCCCILSGMAESRIHFHLPALWLSVSNTQIRSQSAFSVKIILYFGIPSGLH